MNVKDARGLALSTAHTASAAAYDHALDLFNSFRLDPMAVITLALEADPEFISGHLLTAGMLLSAFDPQLMALARESLARAAKSSHRATAREQSLQGALQIWADGNLDRGNRLLDRHLVDYPRDLLALQLAHLGDLVLGRTTMLRDRIMRAMPAWSEQDAGYGYLLGMQAFGLEECFAFGKAEEAGRRAVALQPHDAWAIHAVAHVCEMQGRPADGIAWMAATRPHWDVSNSMAVHNHWHLALMHLASGDNAAALALYDAAIKPQPESIALDLIDASALLWRLQLRGVDVGARWKALAARWREQGQGLWGQMHFNDIHAAISFAASGDEAGVAALIRGFADAAQRPGAPVAWSAVAPSVCEAVSAMARGQHTRCTELLLPVLPIALAMGGSHAQRGLLLLTAQEAAHRDGDRSLASALDAESRVHHVLPTLALRKQEAQRRNPELALA